MLDVSNVAEKMIMYRAENNLTQSEFAKKLNISRITICKIETGKVIPKKTTALKILLYISKGSDSSDVENYNEEN